MMHIFKKSGLKYVRVVGGLRTVGRREKRRKYTVKKKNKDILGISIWPATLSTLWMLKPMGLKQNNCVGLKK